MRKFFEFLAQIDRRWIYIIVLSGAVLPLLFKVKFSFEPLPEVQKAYEEVERLKPEDRVLISIDYDAASMPELQPLLEVMLAHLFRKDIKVLMMGHWPLGLPLGQIALQKMAKEYKKEYGKDYIFLGYRPGMAAVMLNLGREIRTVFAEDYLGTPLDSFPITKNVHNYRDIELLIGFEAGIVGDYWVQFAQARFGQKIILTSTAVVTPDLYPYLQAEQIVGLIGGLRGSADYEQLVKKPGFANIGMPVQTIIHILVLIFILIGNIGFFALKRFKR